MPATASNGLPCLEKNLGEHKQIFFFAANIFNTRKTWIVEELCFLTFGNCLLYVESIGSNFEFDLILGVIKFGFSHLDFMLCVEILGWTQRFVAKKRFLCNMSTDVVNKLSNSARNTGFPSILTQVSLSSLLSWLPVLVLMDSWW